MGKKILKNAWAIVLGIIFVALISWIYVTSIKPIERVVSELNNLFYDTMLRATLSKLPPIKNDNIAIIAIDDESIEQQGRWPWSRKKMAQLVLALKNAEVSVAAFDIIFSEEERNLVSETIAEVNKMPPEDRPKLPPGLEDLSPFFNYDHRFATSLKEIESVLGFVLNDDDDVIGALPAPLLQNDKAVDIPILRGVLGNIPVLQEAAVHGGFLNSDPDSDGTLRHTNLLLAFGDAVYGSLALEATRSFLLSENVKLITSDYDDNSVLDGIQMDQFVIPTDEQGRLLIPFRGGPYTFPYFSATDVLENRVAAKELSGKLVFIGATATGLGDIQPAAVAPEYPGVEVHASIASAILDQYFPSKPVWGKGLEFLLILTLGLLAAIIFPFLSATWLSIFSITAIILWLGTTTWLWITHGILLTLLFPLLAVLLIAFANMVHSYLTASRQRKEIKNVFGQYVPQQHIETILKSSDEVLLSGESRELSVLFSDIRGFTTMSEKMTASELKTQLNEYLTAMTAEIFKLEGTIDKYVGDMIMAFWNAPLTEPLHANKAILAGLNMQKELKNVNESFVAKGLPSIGIGVGINTGMINVGDMGSKYRRAYTAIGDAVNLASRLEGMCRQYEVEVLVGEETYKATKENFVFIHVDKVKVKGKLQGVNVYSPLGLPEEISEQQLAEIAKYHEALDFYFKQEWDKAEKLFKDLIKKSERPLYTLYLERVQEFKITPPQEGWDGAYISKSK